QPRRGELMFEWLRRSQKWTPPQVCGEENILRKLVPADVPISRNARWNGSELAVISKEAATIALFDVTLPDLEQCRILYPFHIQLNNLAAFVYPEMWCRIPEKGMFFSRGIDRKTRGTVDWTEVTIPFFLEQGQRADLVHLNLAFEGAGEVRLKDIQVSWAITA